MSTRRTLSLVLSTGLAAVLPGTLALAQQTFPPTNPVYQYSAPDAVTGDNAFNFGGFRYFSVDAGADSYQNNLYERPTAAAYQFQGTTYAAEEYFGYVDITGVRFGFDDNYAYFSMNLFNLLKQTKDGANSVDGLKAKYGVRMSGDRNGRNGIYLRVSEPAFAGFPSTVFYSAQTEGWRDTDRDVGGRGGPIHGNGGPSGLSVTKVNNVLEEQGMNGYDQNFVYSDGLTDAGIPVMWQRVSPTNNLVTEFAIDYLALGLTKVDLDSMRLVDFEAVEGSPSGPEFGLWNDKFTGIEAGSPNPGIGTDNEFGIQGLGGISAADTARLIVVPTCPADYNFDRVVDDADFILFVEAYNLIETPPADFRADINGDGLVDDADFGLFAAAYDVLICP
jgi:hypothetical protein